LQINKSSFQNQLLQPAGEYLQVFLFIINTDLISSLKTL
jgi:hypothetical protein